VTDSATQAPVVGAQIIALGTTRGALTDTAGAYVLRVPPGTVSLRVQRLGYAPVQRTISASLTSEASADFRMHAVVTTLSEVQVIGYGTQDRSQVTGAVTTLQGSEIQDQPVAGIDAALQGRAPGVQVTQNSGEPGNGISVRIRGAASISASNQPLYVVDGVPIQNDGLSQLFPSGGQEPTSVTGIDPNEIESITVLKDAASAAIYGSRAANGVVMITTKRGASGRAKFSIDASTGFQNAATRLKLMNSNQYVTFMNEAIFNDEEDLLFTPSLADGPSNDWQSDIFRTAPTSNLHLGLSGGNDQLRYMVDGSYFTQTGIVIGSAYNRANGRVNVDYDATPKFSIKTSLALSRENTDRVEGDNSNDGIVTNAIGNPPIFPVLKDDGTFFGKDDRIDGTRLYLTNSVAIAHYDRLPGVTDHVLGNIEGNYHFSPSFTFTGRASTDIVHLQEDQWQSPLVIGTYAEGAGGVAKSAFNNSNRYVLEGFGTYQVGSDAGSSLTAIGGGSVEYNTGESNFLRGEGFSSPALQYVGSATSIVTYGGVPNAEHNLESFFARANYSYKNRYLLSGSLRADGDSRFGPNNRWAYFPALSGGWVLSDESFMGNFKDKFGSLKLRGSYGETGNNNIPSFRYLSTFASAPYGSLPGIAPNAIGNPNFKWESTKEWDGGLDWTPFNSRISIIADYYNKKTSDLIVDRPVLAVSGYTDYFDNIGEAVNHGFEFGLNSQNFRSAKSNGFTWSTDFNISFNHNEITKLYGDQPVPGTNFREISRVAVGQPIGEFYVLHFKGVDPATGDAIYSDTSVNAGSPQPKFWGGLGNTVSYKGLELRGFLEFSHGAKVFNLMRIFADDGGYHRDNKFTYALNRWQNPGDITDEPRASWDGTSGAEVISDRFIEDGSYLRIQEITLSWKLPGHLFASRGLDNAKVYVSGHNLHTFTKYTGYDPDVNSNGTSNIDLGTDYYAYPRARTFTFGVSSQW
ncbi:MAG TPA: TonB-dependent receptor, partial [Gemmatimonadaceae bacterium]|nr:TonB-dependent receptor [Gemmatimonadaceae bacterium]